MKKGATLFTMMGSDMFEAPVIKALLDMEITSGCFDNMYSHNDEPVFANIIDEIDGRASIMYAQEFLSYVGGGKGVLLAGVAGINPCEVLIIGDGTTTYAAAKAAMAAGAYVTLMNNDISALQVAKQVCGDTLNTIAIHPRVLFNKVKTADVILIGKCTRPFEFPKNSLWLLKILYMCSTLKRPTLYIRATHSGNGHVECDCEFLRRTHHKRWGQQYGGKHSGCANGNCDLSRQTCRQTYRLLS